ncbi:MAG TPA: hypothetical protein VKP88_05985 [Candidatus Paceibacterota bacterium]|nr:hypothetical protein [Candidatus Paceibacterota bacterium]
MKYGIYIDDKKISETELSQDKPTAKETATYIGRNGDKHYFRCVDGVCSVVSEQPLDLEIGETVKVLRE